MHRRALGIYPLALIFILIASHPLRAQDQPVEVKVHWDQVIRVSKTAPSVMLGSGPGVWRGSATHDPIFRIIKELGADDVRFAGGGYLYPHYGVAELAPPTATTTSWDFSKLDPVTEDVMNALQGHPDRPEFHHHPGVDVQADGTRALPGGPDQDVLGLRTRQGTA